jgi:peptide/nickel transport system ATP-binding protein
MIDTRKKLVEVKNLKKYFNTKKGMLHAVDGVNLDIYEGETLGLVGESGCGKSTLGRVMIRLLEATSGEVLFEGKDILKFKSSQMKELRKNMQIVFQDPYSSLNPRMSVSELISEPLVVNRVFSRNADMDKRVLDLMDTVGLARRLVRSYPHELDGGRRQRIGVARALALDPKFIVLDEPVSALDVCVQAQILNLLDNLQKEQNFTYVFIAHDLSVVKHVSDHIAVMYLGKIVELTDDKTLFEDPLHPYTQALLSAIPIPRIGAKRERIILEGDVPSPIAPPEGCRFASRCRYRKEICYKETPLLREIDPKHFAACHFVRNLVPNDRIANKHLTANL